ncbi:hypothetical protein BASA81_001302 [Batrachochytrium salamandrivorans]|nr:hypothetical protein BASA81_001302 [Batrachochytrium salamandrivorans]
MFRPSNLGPYGQFASSSPFQMMWYNPTVLSSWNVPPPPSQQLLWPATYRSIFYQPPQPAMVSLPPPKRARIVTKDAENCSYNNEDEDDEELFKKTRRNRRSRSLGATGIKDSEPNGETRLEIKFISFGSLPSNPDHVQKWGKKGVIPDGLAGRFTFYGEDWAFSVKYHELVVCADGVERYLIEFGIQHKHWEVSETETDEQCRDRHNKGYTICNHVFALALEQRAKDYQELMQRELQKEFPNTNQIQQCQTRVDKLVPKRVSEGPLLFGLRHKTVRDAAIQMSQPSSTSL